MAASTFFSARCRQVETGGGCLSAPGAALFRKMGCTGAAQLDGNGEGATCLWECPLQGWSHSGHKTNTALLPTTGSSCGKSWRRLRIKRPSRLPVSWTSALRQRLFWCLDGGLLAMRRGQMMGLAMRPFHQQQTTSRGRLRALFLIRLRPPALHTICPTPNRNC